MKYINPFIESSYRKNNLGKTLYDLVLELKPRKIIEFGALNGYSTVAMAMALDELKQGSIKVYDLWEKYPHKKGNKEAVIGALDDYQLRKYVTLADRDFYNWLSRPSKFDLLHVDISNDGDVIEKLQKAIQNHIDWGATVIFEGGSRERDEVEWMKKYNRRKINHSGVVYEIINSDFPSLSRIK